MGEMERKKSNNAEPPRNGGAVRCWEHLNCPAETRDSCPAFTSQNGKECWMISEKRCGGGTMNRRSIEEKLVECSRCDYYTTVLKKK